MTSPLVPDVERVLRRDGGGDLFRMLEFAVSTGTRDSRHFERLFLMTTVESEIATLRPMGQRRT